MSFDSFGGIPSGGRGRLLWLRATQHLLRGVEFPERTACTERWEVVAFVFKDFQLRRLVPPERAGAVKAHPLEIFLVIMIAASVAGIPGMILAIPSYTLLRIIAKQFLSKFGGLMGKNITQATICKVAFHIEEYILSYVQGIGTLREKLYTL